MGRFQTEEKRGGNYFAKEPSPLFIRSGCTLLDKVLGGGWALGKIVNVIGDQSVGKTLLAIESCANLYRQYPKARIDYRDVEAAFDVDYAEKLGLPVEVVSFGPDDRESQWETVEDIYEDLDAVLTDVEQLMKEKKLTRKTVPPGIYIIDSLDALSSRAELKRTIGEGSYSLEKPKVIGELLRRMKHRLNRTRTCLFIISQLRDKIGVTFGRKYTRSGGKALGYYCSQILHLGNLGDIHRTYGGVKRPIGVLVRARTDKNKIGLPHRTVEFLLKFGFGVDDVATSVNWLVNEVNAGDKIGFEKKKKAKADEQTPITAFTDKIDALPKGEYEREAEKISDIASQVWDSIEQDFAPTRSKYG